MSIFFYIISQSWTDFFKINGKIPIYMLFSLPIIFNVFRLKEIKKNTYDIGDLSIVLLIIYICIISLFNFNSKTLIYLFTYSYILGGLYFIMKCVLLNKVSGNKLLKINYYGVYITLHYILIEFISLNFFGINIQNFMLRNRKNTATFLGKFTRAYGFSTEPGVIAYYLTTLGMLALFYIFYISNFSWKKKLYLSLVFILGEFFIYSTTGIFAILIGIFICFFVKFKISKKRYLNKLIKNMMIILFLVILIFYNVDLLSEYLLPIFNKISKISEIGSGSKRIERWKEAIAIIQNNPITGIGLGAFSSRGEGSPISWYLFMAAETGIFSLVFLFIFYLSKFLLLVRSEIKGSGFMIVGLVGGIIHLAVISTFQYPYIFLYIIIIETYLKNQKET